MIAITLSNSVSAFRSGGIVSGTYEVTVQPFENGAYYAVAVDDPAYVVIVSKTASERWMFILNVPESSFPGPYYAYTNYESVVINTAWNAIQVATAVYNAAITAGFNVTINDSTLTFTASQIGNLTDSIGSPAPTITQGS